MIVWFGEQSAALEYSLARADFVRQGPIILETYCWLEKSANAPPIWRTVLAEILQEVYAFVILVLLCRLLL